MSAPTPIADMITEMLKNCIPLEMIIVAVRSMERAVSTRQGVDGTAEKRRAWDREYRRNKRGMSADPPDIHPKPPDVGNGALPFLQEDKKHSEVVRKKERGCKLPPDWKPNEKHYGDGAKLGMNRTAVDDRAAAMRCWCDANANRSITTKANWDAAFSGAWLKDPNQRNGTPNGKTQDNPRAGSLIGAIDRRLAEIARESDLALPEDNLLRLPDRSIQRP
jgi:hypothetical protein